VPSPALGLSFEYNLAQRVAHASPPASFLYSVRHAARHQAFGSLSRGTRWRALTRSGRSSEYNIDEACGACVPACESHAPPIPLREIRSVVPYFVPSARSRSTSDPNSRTTETNSRNDADFFRKSSSFGPIGSIDPALSAYDPLNAKYAWFNRRM
jgi:hypothetical protein